MSVFAIVLREPNKHVQGRVDAEYPTCFWLSPTFAVVATDELTEKVATRVGIKGDDRVPDASGVVLMLGGPYSGYTDRSLWEWLKKYEDYL